MANILQIILLLFVFGVVAAIPILLSNAAQNTVGAQTGGTSIQLVNGVQEVRIHASTSGYSLTSFTVKKGVPVKILFSADKYAGCGRQLIMSDFGVSKLVGDNEEVPIEFTPDKTGTFAYRCSMNMYRGTMTVVA